MSDLLKLNCLAFCLMSSRYGERRLDELGSENRTPENADIRRKIQYQRDPIRQPCQRSYVRNDVHQKFQPSEDSVGTQCQQQARTLWQWFCGVPSTEPNFCRRGTEYPKYSTQKLKNQCQCKLPGIVCLLFENIEDLKSSSKSSQSSKEQEDVHEPVKLSSTFFQGELHATRLKAFDPAVVLPSQEQINCSSANSYDRHDPCRTCWPDSTLQIHLNDAQNGDREQRPEQFGKLINEFFKSRGSWRRRRHAGVYEILKQSHLKYVAPALARIGTK